jgi:capsular polysaccharide biosynthesis protein
MSSEYVIDIFELWRIVLRRRWLVLASVLLFVAGTGVATLLTPRIYRCRSTISLPGEPYRWIGIPEVKEMVTAAWARANRGKLLNGMKSEDVNKIKAIKVQEIPGSETIFKLVVTTKNDANLAREISGVIFQFLATDSTVQSRLKVVAQGADSVIAFAEKIFRNYQSRNRFPNMRDAELVALYDKVIEYRIRRANMRNFEYISPPELELSPVSPRPWINLSVASLVGLMVGILLSVTIDRKNDC